MREIVWKACQALFDAQYNGPYQAQDAIDDPHLAHSLHGDVCDVVAIDDLIAAVGQYDG